jgi:hypothetical protein
MQLFEREGEDTSDMLVAIVTLQQRIAALEPPAIPSRQHQLPHQPEQQGHQAAVSNSLADSRFQELKDAANAWNAAGDKTRARVYLQQAKVIIMLFVQTKKLLERMKFEECVIVDKVDFRLLIFFLKRI